MAVAVGVFSEARQRTLRAVCDTIAPSLESDSQDPVLRAFLARSASDMDIPSQIEGLLAQTALPEEIEALGQLLDAFAAQDFASLSLEARTQLLHAIAAAGPETKLGVRQLRALTLLFFYALPDETGRNDNWDALSYPGPISAPPSAEQAPKTIPLTHLEGESATLTADVCVIGSGAGGGVIAAELAQAGRSVVVLEMGGYRNEADFKQLELLAYFELYLGGGLASSEDGSIALFAGSTLGGGTVVNWLNSIPTPADIREEWASMGLEGVDDPGYERHVESVWARLSVNEEATSQNRTHRRLIEAFEELGYSHRALMRNADRTCDDPQACGYCYAGCQKGCKQSTLKTYLQDAADAGASFVVGARAERVLLADRRTVGVEASITNEDGSATTLTVQAPTVVVACGAIESPALLLRSGIGGPAAGRHLRLHPASLVLGEYEQPIEGWIGQIQSALSDEFTRCEGEHGFLIEGAPVAPALEANALPWVDGRRHKETLARMAHLAPFISVARDHGEGRVVIDGHGRAVVQWSLSDEIDERLFRRAQVELAKLHRAAGARGVLTTHQAPAIAWREGEDFDAFLAAIEAASLEPNDVAVYSAHQMGSCRMGSDPLESVADGRGELHDMKGVWIGDGSAFPTAPGVNPMISIMSLAHRTAEQILAAQPPPQP
jgi:choline dehydrogenase-like flavoprotein